MNDQILNNRPRPQNFLMKLTLGGTTIALASTIALSMAAASPVQQAAANDSYYFSFEHTLAPWQVAASAWASGFALRQASGDDACPVLSGDHYAALDFTPTSYSPAAWMDATFRGSGLDVVTVDWAAKDKGSCKLCQPIFYVGSEAPTSSSQFEANGSTLTAIWQAHHYPLPPNLVGPIRNRGTIHVAIGLQAPGGNVANATLTGGSDCVNIHVTPVTEGEPSGGLK